MGKHGRSQRQKGNRHERRIVDLLTRKGLTARRVPSSGSAGGTEFGGDVVVWGTIRFEPRSVSRIRIEAKHRKDGFRTLYDWLDGIETGPSDLPALVIRADRKDDLLVVRLRDLEPRGDLNQIDFLDGRKDG